MSLLVFNFTAIHVSLTREFILSTVSLPFYQLYPVLWPTVQSTSLWDIVLGLRVPAQPPLMQTQVGCEASAEAVKVLRECYENVTLYNQSVRAALEILIRDLSKVNSLHEKVFSKL